MVKVFFKGIGYAERYLEEIKTELQRRLCVTQVGNERECECCSLLFLCLIMVMPMHLGGFSYHLWCGIFLWVIFVSHTVFALM